MDIVSSFLIFIHIVAFIAGGANAVVHPIIDPRMAKAGPQERAALDSLRSTLGRVGKWSMVVLLISGLLVLWLKWNFAPPNFWFWIKMLGVVGMLAFIGMNEAASKKARSGDAAALQRSDMAGKLTAACFAVVVLAAVFAFH